VLGVLSGLARPSLVRAAAIGCSSAVACWLLHRVDWWPDSGSGLMSPAQGSFIIEELTELVQVIVAAGDGLIVAVGEGLRVRGCPRRRYWLQLRCRLLVSSAC